MSAEKGEAMSDKLTKAEKLARAMDNVRSGGRDFNSQLAAQVSQELRAQAERIKELEHFLAQEKKISEKDHGVWCDNYAALDRKYKTARNDALREALEVTDNDYSASCPSCSTVQSKLTALIEGESHD